ncbi:MAG: diaminobutyrate--2-oxoglutarate transaminase [Micromonosporaceae bacterium]
METNVFEEVESEVRAYCRNWPAVFDRARGSHVYDRDGRAYLDFFTGVATLSYGHNHPVLKRALLDYLERDGLMHSLDTYTVAKEEFLHRFREHVLTPRQLDYKVMFPAPTGTNAVEAALKLARKVTGRTTVARFANGFHGLTLGSLALTSNALKRGAAGVPLGHALTLAYDGYLDDPMAGLTWLARLLDDPGSGEEPPAAVIVEVVQGEGGLTAARPQWLQALAGICRRHNVLLIVDDVLMGCGRTGPFFSFESAGIEPDIVCLSKALSGYGLPFALTLFRSDLDVWRPGEHSGTFRGNNAAFVTAATALETFWAGGGLEQQTAQKSEHLRAGLAGIVAEHADAGAAVRGSGLAIGLFLEPEGLATATCRAAFERGLLVEACGPRRQVVMLLPPLTASVEELTTGLDLLTDALTHARQLADGRPRVPSLR